MAGPDAWSKPSNDPTGRMVKICVKCKVKIHVWHCSNLGCQWCAMCGSKATNRE